MARYKRYLSEQFLHLLDSGPLHFVAENCRQGWNDDRYALDLQIRENDTVQLYHGTTYLLKLQLRHDSVVNASAAPAYGRYSGCRNEYHQLMQDWDLATEADRFEEAAVKYLHAAIAAAHDKYYRNRREGFWQNVLAISQGPTWSPDAPWFVIDREVVIGFSDQAAKNAFYEAVKRPYAKLQHELHVEHNWATPHNVGDELDLLAITPDSELVCVEVKHGGNTSGIYYGSIQAAIYGDAFKKALKAITPGIIRLIEQKVQLGVLPLSAKKYLPNGGFKKVSTCLVVGDPRRRGACWSRLKTVMATDQRTRMPVYGISDAVNPVVFPLPEFTQD